MPTSALIEPSKSTRPRREADDSPPARLCRHTLHRAVRVGRRARVLSRLGDVLSLWRAARVHVFLRSRSKVVTAAVRMVFPGLVESVIRCRQNGPLIAAAAELWIDSDDLVVDVTYGKGNFWTVFRPTQLVAHDLYNGDGVDFRSLPEADESVDVVVLDPPYIPQGGRDTSTTQDFLDRYGLQEVPKTRGELEVLIAEGITEATRVLKPSGRLFVKCMDYINGGRFCQGRHAVVTAAHFAGLEQVDEFVHHSGTGPQPTGRAQLHSRRAHSFLCVFQKPPIRRKS
jgi:hypothetical protein